MQLTKAEINQLNGLCQAVIGKWRHDEKVKDIKKFHDKKINDSKIRMELLQFAIFDLMDNIYPEYIKFAKDTNDILFKYAESEDGKPKYKTQLIDIKNTEPKPKEFLWKNEGDDKKYDIELDEYLKSVTEIKVRQYPAKDLLETRIMIHETEIYSLLKYIAL